MGGWLDEKRYKIFSPPKLNTTETTSLYSRFVCYANVMWVYINYCQRETEKYLTT